MTSHVTRALAGAVVATLGLSTASAQDVRGYAGAAGMVSTQGSHRQGSAPSLPTSGADGTAAGVTAEIGAFVTPRVALGIEISVPRRFMSVQQVDYLRVFQHESRHRDLMISGVARVMTAPGRRVQLGVVGGGGLVQESTRQRQRDQAGLLPTFPPVFGRYSDEYSFSRWTVAALVGGDIAIAITSRIAVVPQVHVIRRSSDPSEPGWALGLNSVVLRPAVGVRVTF
jgi:hypothetical protein